MRQAAIPVHHLEGDQPFSVRVERITKAPGPVSNEVHRHDFHEIFFFERGEGMHMIDLAHHAISAPCVHLVAPGQVHQLGRSGDTIGSVLMFTREAALGPAASDASHELFRTDAPSPCFGLPASAFAEVQVLLSLIEQEEQRAEATSERVVRNYLDVVLTKCGQWRRDSSAGQPDHADAHDVVRRFTAEVDLRFLDERTVVAYAELFSISAGHLNELVKKRMGQSASEVINARLILEAKRLLLHADLSVKEVGYALRMSDPAYFSRVFRRSTGMTPLEYRQHIRGKYQR